MGTEGMRPKIADIQFSVNDTSCKCMAESKRKEGKGKKGVFPCFIIYNNTNFVLKFKICM